MFGDLKAFPRKSFALTEQTGKKTIFLECFEQTIIDKFCRRKRSLFASILLEFHSCRRNARTELDRRCRARRKDTLGWRQKLDGKKEFPGAERDKSPQNHRLELRQFTISYAAILSG
jgi:hypothetical protein